VWEANGWGVPCWRHRNRRPRRAWGGCHAHIACASHHACLGWILCSSKTAPEGPGHGVALGGAASLAAACLVQEAPAPLKRSRAQAGLPLHGGQRAKRAASGGAPPPAADPTTAREQLPGDASATAAAAVAAAVNSVLAASAQASAVPQLAPLLPTLTPATGCAGQQLLLLLPDALPPAFPLPLLAAQQPVPVSLQPPAMLVSAPSPAAPAGGDMQPAGASRSPAAWAWTGSSHDQDKPTRLNWSADMHAK